MTLQQIIAKTTLELEKSGNVTAALDAKVLLEHVLRQDDVYLITHNVDLISNAQYQKFRRLIRRRTKGEPIAYLVGHKEFFGLDLIVNKNVLIPRPETEVLVEQAIKYLETKNCKLKTVLDIGTGSGCIIISIIKNLLSETCDLKAFGVDISKAALRVAKQNAKKHEVYDNIRFLKSDLLRNQYLPKKFDLIIANLPYLTQPKKNLVYSAPGQTGLAFEPDQALYAEDGGFGLIEKLITQLPQRLHAEGSALLEVDESHLNRIFTLCAKLGLKSEILLNQSQFQGFVKITL